MPKPLCIVPSLRPLRQGSNRERPSGYVESAGAQARVEQLAILTRLAAMRPAESGREAATAIKQVAAKTASEDQAIAVEYLTAIPLSVRRALVPADPPLRTGRCRLRAGRPAQGRGPAAGEDLPGDPDGGTSVLMGRYLEGPGPA